MGVRPIVDVLGRCESSDRLRERVNLRAVVVEHDFERLTVSENQRLKLVSLKVWNKTRLIEVLPPHDLSSVDGFR